VTKHIKDIFRGKTKGKTIFDCVGNKIGTYDNPEEFEKKKNEFNYYLNTAKNTEENEK
jgi:hypothetical protein